ncbi:SixA phosphatase family protein [Aquimarina sp. M1]
MKLLFRLLILTTFFGSCAQTKDTQANTTTYILVRHAEKDLTDNANPNLTQKGKQRARKLAKLYTNTTIDFVFSTDYNRTMQTATPLAKSKNLKILKYDPQNLYSTEFRQKTKGKTSLIVGHSNTTPDFVNKILGESKYQDIQEDNYDQIFTIIIKGNQITDTITRYH